jgi:hypothetical protein
VKVEVPQFSDAVEVDSFEKWEEPEDAKETLLIR